MGMYAHTWRVLRDIWNYVTCTPEVRRIMVFPDFWNLFRGSEAGSRLQGDGN